MTANERLQRTQVTPEQIKTELQYLKANLRCDEIIKLKVGSQVMCIVNTELANGEMLCNGSQGIVTRFSQEGSPVIRFSRSNNSSNSSSNINDNSFELAMNYHIWPSETIPGVGVSQLPLILAWALTIHKAQGATLDVAEIDAGSNIFECGQTYVALSRVKSLEGLYLTSYDAKKIRINKKVQEFYTSLNEVKSVSEAIVKNEVENVSVSKVQNVIGVKSVENVSVNEVIVNGDEMTKIIVLK